MTRLATLTFLLSFGITFSQDTIWVQTFTYDTISTRRAIFPFPATLDGESFEKVLMYYNLKCDPLTPWDSYDCGEWDYLAYAHVYDHTGNLDSNKIEGPQFLVNNQYQDPVQYVTAPYYNYFENYQYVINYSAETDNDFSVGSGTSNQSHPFGASNSAQRTQILWTAAELSAAGVTAGNIDKLRFDLSSVGGSMGNLTLKLKHTAVSDIYSFDNSGFTSSYQLNTAFVSAGVNTINLTYPFAYDGTSNLLIEISFENAVPSGADNVLFSEVTVNNSVVYTDEKLGYLNIPAGEYAQIELSDYDFGNEMTISFWSRGDAAFLPQNTSVLEAKDSLGNRVINIHHPWSNERIYWDAGRGGPYDRIDQASAVSDYEANWHHWAFTKNAVSGVMNIYKDGVLWLTGSSKILPIGIVNKFILGANMNGDNGWSGAIDEFQIWDSELDVTDIAGWMDQKITAAHPEYANLVVYYDFDNNSEIIDQSVNGFDAMMTSADMLTFYDGSQAGHISQMERPNIVFVQGTYTSTLDSVLVTDSVLVNPLDLLEYAVDGRKFVVSDIDHFYPVGYSYTFDVAGVATDSVFHGADDSFANDSIFYYQEPYEVVVQYEMGRYITPYGIGFDLGPNGFTYIYDVSDYQSLLHGDVDFEAHNTQELIDVKFAFILGTPPREVIALEQLWGGIGSYSYANLDNDVSLSEIDVVMDPAAEMYKLRTRLTGHGQVGSNNCCEWGEGRFHKVYIDGTERFNWDIFQETECGDNPNIGQGGTWPYAREGWCPGDKVHDNEFEVTPFVTPGSTAGFDYDITDVPTGDPAQGGGNYVMSMHLVSYGSPNFNNDAAIVDVLNPTGWEYYSKWNPTCQNPRVILRNTGANDLTECDIHVWIGALANTASIHWTGNLGFLEEQVVEIPVTSTWWYDWEGSNVFSARVIDPNGVADEYTPNSTFSTTFDAPDAILVPFYIWFKTNNKAIENDIWLLDDQGDTVFSRFSLTNSTEYKDTMNLPAGCYTLEVYDTDHDGLGYWYSNIPTTSGGEGETNGFLRLREVGGSIIKNFTTDWGHYLSYSFSVGYGVGLDESTHYDFDIYPNPTEGMMHLTLNNFTGDQVDLKVTDEMGRLIYFELLGENNPEGYWQKQLDLSIFPGGIYTVTVTSDDLTASRRIVVK